MSTERESKDDTEVGGGGGSDSGLGVARYGSVGSVPVGRTVTVNVPVRNTSPISKQFSNLKTYIQNNRTYYHGSPAELPVGTRLRNGRRDQSGASATSNKKVAARFAGRWVPPSFDTTPTIYKVKAVNSDVVKSTKNNGLKEYNSRNFVVVGQTKIPKKYKNRGD
jgi:hypothetical protein